MEIKEQLDRIENLLIQINSKIDSHESRLDKIEVSTGKMDNHIEFIEETYTTLKSPLNFVKKNVERIMGKTETKNLPSIKDKDKDK
jgi:archaellum component FlaC